jgi:beta-glucosidase
VGDIDAAGRLPVTFPASYDQEPTASSQDAYPGVPDSALDTNAPGFVYYKETFTEGVFPDYRWFDAHHLTPAYPFGFGLSYTTFRLSHLKLAPSSSGPGATVSVTVRNTGRRTGYAVPELYLASRRAMPCLSRRFGSPASRSWRSHPSTARPCRWRSTPAI